MGSYVREKATHVFKGEFYYIRSVERDSLSTFIKMLDFISRLLVVIFLSNISISIT